MEFKCVLSVGIRCFTEIFLKKMNYKKFSSPFDGTYLTSVNDIIYLLENKIKTTDLKYTCDYPEIFDILNKQHGYRTIHTKIKSPFVSKSNFHQYHYCAFPHHNLKEKHTIEHFDRCFKRLNIIKHNKIPTLFCLFMHPKYAGYVNVTQKDIVILSKYLKEQFNCHLLVCYFIAGQISSTYMCIKTTSDYSIYIINSDSVDYERIKNPLNTIMNNYIKNKKQLLSYETLMEYSTSE
jgi:hypothetical protein